MDSERQLFLYTAVDEDNVESSCPRSQSSKFSCGFSVSIHISLIFLYTAASLVLIKYNSTCQLSTNGSPNAIDRLAVHYDSHTYNLYPSSKYAGPPDPKIDEQWKELLAPIGIRVTKEELEKNNRTSVELPEGGGYLAWLGVFYELHCVKLLRQWKYKDHYYLNMTEKEAYNLESHTNHCLDRIRASFMCHPDVSSLVTFFWNTSDTPVVDGTKTLHSCVKWDEMIESTKHRAVSAEELAALRNPLLLAPTP